MTDNNIDDGHERMVTDYDDYSAYVYGDAYDEDADGDDADTSINADTRHAITTPND